jgi:hypothetical protein
MMNNLETPLMKSDNFLMQFATIGMVDSLPSPLRRITIRSAIDMMSCVQELIVFNQLAQDVERILPT